MKQTPGPDREMNRQIWTAGIIAMVASLAAVLILLGLLTLGWNSPRPAGPPDWRAEGLPLVLEAQPGETTVHLLPWSGDHFTLEAVVDCLSGPDFNGIGLIFQARDREDYSVFAIGSDGYLAILQVADETATPRLPWQQFPHVQRGHSENRLRLSCAGSTCRFYVNDEYATSIDYDAQGGSIGVWVSSPDDEPVTAAFTTIWVWETNPDSSQ